MHEEVQGWDGVLGPETVCAGQGIKIRFVWLAVRIDTTLCLVFHSLS